MIALAKAPSCSAIGSKTQSSDRWQERFACLLPSIARHARFLVKHLSAEAAEEAVQEAVATAFVAYARLVKLGKEESTSAGPLARYAMRRTAQWPYDGRPRQCQRRYVAMVPVSPRHP